MTYDMEDVLQSFIEDYKSVIGPKSAFAAIFYSFLCRKIIVTHRLELQELDLFVNARGAFTLVHPDLLFSIHLSTSYLFVGSHRRRRPSGLLRVMVSRFRLTANGMWMRVRLPLLLAVF